jgi:hypothetical protein
MVPYVPLPSPRTALVPDRDFIVENGNPTESPVPWFLKDETWVLHHYTQIQKCVTVVQLEPFIFAVRDMMQIWVKAGHNMFLHRRLYEKGMPTCLQDAFTTLASYISCTAEMKDLVLQIAEERSSKLVQEPPPDISGYQEILQHIARVHALFVYAFIRLFDGSIRLRTSAERQLPTLRKWVREMLEAAKQYQGEEGILTPQPFSCTTSGFDKTFHASSELWHLWILTESVRRTHLLVETVANLYDTMTKEWAVDCTGAVMLTAQRGLWDAESAVKWYKLTNTEQTLLVTPLQPGPVMSKYAAKEFDDFVKIIWSFIAGADQVQCWIDKAD